MEITYRQLLLNKLAVNGIGLSGRIIDDQLKQFNNYQMCLNERMKRLIEIQPEFDEFITYLTFNPDNNNQ